MREFAFWRAEARESEDRRDGDDREHRPEFGDPEEIINTISEAMIVAVIDVVWPSRS